MKRARSRFSLLIGLAVFFSISARAVSHAQTPSEFALPQPGYQYSFPRDHGAHFEFRLEWWYLTGHLAAESGRVFGYQATFFRSALPGGKSQLYLAHMALLDLEGKTFHHQERLNRAGWDAAADAGTLNVRNGPWSLRMLDDRSETMELKAGIRAEVAFEFQLRPEKPRVIFGENGVSRKGEDPSAASYYITFTRLETRGTLRLGEREFRVVGRSWMDHEISSSQLSARQVGWDWVSLHLDDGRDVMCYRLRLRDGGSDPASTLTWVDTEAALSRQPFSWEVVERWKSEATGAVYPSTVRLRTTDPKTGAPAAFLIEPLMAEQELTGQLGGIPYWEGACRVRDEQGREIGRAYMELTGYAKDLKF